MKLWPQATVPRLVELIQNLVDAVSGFAQQVQAVSRMKVQVQAVFGKQLPQQNYQVASKRFHKRDVLMALCIYVEGDLFPIAFVVYDPKKQELMCAQDFPSFISNMNLLIVSGKSKAQQDDIRWRPHGRHGEGMKLTLAMLKSVAGTITFYMFKRKLEVVEKPVGGGVSQVCTMEEKKLCTDVVPQIDLLISPFDCSFIRLSSRFPPDPATHQDSPWSLASSPQGPSSAEGGW